MLAGVAGRSRVINGGVEQRRLAVAGMDWALPVVGLPFVEAAVTGIYAAQIFRWQAREQEWVFVALPAELSADIREIPRPRRGFGSVRVEARIGLSRWRTSIFPDASQGGYVLPLKRAVREAEGIGVDGVIAVWLEVLDA